MFFSCLSMVCVWGSDNEDHPMPGTSPHMSRTSTSSDSVTGAEQKSTLESVLETLPLRYDDPTVLERLKEYALTNQAEPRAVSALITVLETLTDSEDLEAQKAIAKLEKRIQSSDTSSAPQIKLWTARNQEYDSLIRERSPQKISGFCNKLESELRETPSISKTNAYSLLVGGYTALGDMTKANEYAEKLDAVNQELNAFITKLITETNSSE